jgi:hypothetical protein
MKIEETIAKLLAEAKKAKVLISEQDKEGSAYAIGMAKAKEITGDEPPLEKETIKKAHEIAKGILKKEETEEEKKKREEEEKAKAQASTKTESEATPNADDKKKEDDKEKEMVKETEMTDDQKKKAEDEAKAKAEKEKADEVKEQELTDKQKTLPPALQKAIKDKEEKKDAVKEETEEEKAKREAEEKAKAEKEKAEVKSESEDKEDEDKKKDTEDKKDSEIKENGEEDDEEDDDKEEMKSESEEEDDEKIKDKNAKNPDEVKMNEVKVDVSEDVAALLKGETLSEEFKAKAKIIFENVVINRVKDEIARISNDLKVDNAKSMATIKESLIEKVDGYLSYVVEQWILQNEIALESGIKNEIMEEFVNGLRNLFEDHYIEVPNERFDVLTDLQDQLNTTKKKLDEATIENAKITKAFSDLRKNEIISTASKDLVSTDAEKLKALAEELTFEDDASFEKKVQTIRDNYFSALSATQNSTKKVVDTIVTDEPIVINESAKITDVKIAAYADLLTRSKKQI